MAHSVRGFAYETWWFYTVLLVYQKVCRLSQKLWKRCQNCYLKWGNSLRMVKFWDIAHFETNSCPKSCGWNHGIWRSRLGFSMFFDTAHHIKGRAFACVSLAEAWHRPYVLYVSKILPSLLPEMGMDQNLFIGGMNIYIYIRHPFWCSLGQPGFWPHTWNWNVPSTVLFSEITGQFCSSGTKDIMKLPDGWWLWWWWCMCLY